LYFTLLQPPASIKNAVTLVAPLLALTSATYTSAALVLAGENTAKAASITTLEVAFMPGEGTTFTFQFPKAEAAAA
jgi:hypothetical protein